MGGTALTRPLGWTTGRGRTPGARLGERTVSSGSSVELVCVVLARRWQWLSVRLWPDPPIPQSPPRLLATTSTATALLWPRRLATSRTSPPTAPRAADFAQEPPRQPQTPATTCTATAPTSAVTEHTQTSARRPAANAEEILLHQEDEDKDENNTGMLKRRLQILFEFSPIKNYEIY